MNMILGNLCGVKLLNCPVSILRPCQLHRASSSSGSVLFWLRKKYQNENVTLVGRWDGQVNERGRLKCTYGTVEGETSDRVCREHQVNAQKLSPLVEGSRSAKDQLVKAKGHNRKVCLSLCLWESSDVCLHNS
jgi:hypothetical protein